MVKKTRRLKTFSIVALIVAVLGLSIAFAALSKTLTINGTGSVDAAKWKIEITEVSEPDITGSAKQNSVPIISNDGARIEGIDVSVTKPGDRISYMYKIKNNGTISAKINSVLINNVDVLTLTVSAYDDYLTSVLPKCDWDGDGATTASERRKCMDNLRFYSPVIRDTDTVLAPGESKTYTLIFEYYSSSTEIPKGEVESNFNYSIEFVQAN